MNPDATASPDLICHQERLIFCRYQLRALPSLRRFNASTILSLLLLFPRLSTAQTAELTEQLGRTVLYDDIAVSPDGKWVAWVQSTAAIAPKSTYICSTTAGSQAQRV